MFVRFCLFLWGVKILGVKSSFKFIEQNYVFFMVKVHFKHIQSNNGCKSHFKIWCNYGLVFKYFI